ncbi:hypothetical protein BDN72DRAFT_961387 [Pluteus cervinus]|uniref:Uncharacterized protein n=1 Tax=Pluteus cervinus TaxID=181527 RepID=A0ACD3ANV2_9AGAR|nr:hypothetical protein BDN72DRAFT_961387 [Pluteus cervinus]
MLPQKQVTSNEVTSTSHGTCVTPRAGMDDLPVELIHRIIGRSAQDLFTIARLSRYLNAVAISYYFHGRLPRRHIDEITLHFDGHRTYMITQPNEDNATTTKPKFSTQSPIDILSFLSIAFDIQTIGRFNWKSTGANTENRELPERLITQCHRLTVFLRRLDVVHHISLKFHDWNLRWYRMMPSSRILEKWTVVTTGLLNVCMEKMNTNSQGGEGFEMVGGCFPGVDYAIRHKRNWGLRRKGVAGFGETQNPTMHGLDWDIVRLGGDPLMPSDMNVFISTGTESVAKSTKKFKVSSAMLLYPPLSEWTYQFLRSAPLTCLTIDGLFSFAEWWEIFFSWLSIPLRDRLEELTIQNCTHIRARSLADFLQNLRGLKHCVIQDTPTTQALKGNIFFSKLPELVTFTAPSDFLYFMRPKGLQLSKRLLGKPSLLSTLRIFPKCLDSDGHADSSSSSSCRSHVEDVIESYSDVPWIILDFRTSRFSDFAFKNAATGPVKRLDRTKKQPEAPKACYALVKEVVVLENVISWMMRNTPSGEQCSPGVWATFKGLKVLRIVGSQDVMTTIAAREEKETRVSWSGQEDNQYTPFFSQLRKVCTSLEVVKFENVLVDGQVVAYDLSN